MFPTFIGGYVPDPGAQELIDFCSEVAELVHEVNLGSLVVVHVSRSEAVPQKDSASVPEPRLHRNPFYQAAFQERCNHHRQAGLAFDVVQVQIREWKIYRQREAYALHCTPGCERQGRCSIIITSST